MNTYGHRTPASLKSEAAYLRQLSSVAGNASEQIDELADLKEEVEKIHWACCRHCRQLFSNLNDTILNNK